jgi:hypothetical protein
VIHGAPGPQPQSVPVLIKAYVLARLPPFRTYVLVRLAAGIAFVSVRLAAYRSIVLRTLEIRGEVEGRSTCSLSFAPPKLNSRSYHGEPRLHPPGSTRLTILAPARTYTRKSIHPPKYGKPIPTARNSIHEPRPHQRPWSSDRPRDMGFDQDLL